MDLRFWTNQPPYILQSSANNLQMLYLTLVGKSFIKHTNSIGPMTEPCGITLTTAFHLDCSPSTITHCFLPVRNESIQFKTLPFMPMIFNFTNSFYVARNKTLSRNLYKLYIIT